MTEIRLSVSIAAFSPDSALTQSLILLLLLLIHTLWSNMSHPFHMVGLRSISIAMKFTYICSEKHNSIRLFADPITGKQLHIQINIKHMDFLVLVQSLLPLRWGQDRCCRTCLYRRNLSQWIINSFEAWDEPCVPLLPLRWCSVVLPARRVSTLLCAHMQRGGRAVAGVLRPPSAIAVIYTGPFGCQHSSFTLLSERVLTVRGYVMRVHVVRRLACL